MDFKKGTPFTITDKKHPNYQQVFVIMFKVHEGTYGYGKDVNQRFSEGKITEKQIKEIELWKQTKK